MLRESVPAGTEGVVVDAPVFGSAVVRFRIKKLFGDRSVRVTVDDNEIA